MKKVREASPVSNLQVLDVLSDRISIEIFNVIAQKVTTSDRIIKLLGLTHKQYYMRYSYLLKTGLIKRRHSQLTLTCFGQMVYHSLSMIATACKHSSELIMVDAVKATRGIPDNERKDVLDKLIVDPRIKKLFS